MSEQTIGKKKYGGLAFLPLIVFLLIYIGGGIFLTIMGVEKPFSQIPRQSALFVGIVVAFLMDRQTSVDEKLNIFSSRAGEGGIMLMVIIFLLAGAFSGVTSAMGAVDSIVNLCISFLPERFLIPGLFIISALIATAMGTSTGTVAAVAPIALGFADKSGISQAISLTAVSMGALFGDNLSLISDTTIAATRGAGCQMSDKFKMNFLIALPAAIATIVAYAIVGTPGVISDELSFSVLKMIPYFVVLIAAVSGMNVVVVLSGGIFLAGIVGIVTNSLTIGGFLSAIGSGMNGMFNVCIVAVLIRGLIGLTKEYGGIDWLLETSTKRIKTRKGAEYSIAALVSALAFAMANNTVAIIVASPIAKEIGDNYGIAPKRVASLLDIFSCIFLKLAPHSGGMLVLMGLAPITPLEIIKYSYYAFFLGIATIITIQFGLLRTSEEKETVKLEQK